MKPISHQNFGIGFCVIVIAIFGISLDVIAISTARIGRVRELEIIGGHVDAVTLQWKRVARATSYHIRVLQQNIDSETLGQVRVIKKITGRTAAVENLDANTTYGFQVRAVRKKQRGRWSRRITVTTPLADTEEEEEEDDIEENCTSNQSPIFTADITDLAKVSDIVPPPSLSGTVLKTHSFLNTQLERVPVYAPVNAELSYGAFYQEGNPGGEYILAFHISCEMTFIVDHVTEPIDAIRAVFPDTPKEDTRSDYPTSNVELSAGDLIGYTTGTIFGIWDFGVYNSEVQNQFYGVDGIVERDTTAVCPYNYYSAEQRGQYYDLFARSDNRDYPGATDFCFQEAW